MNKTTTSVTSDTAGPSAAAGARGTGPGRSRLQWRVVDIVVLAVLAAACGVIFWAWSNLVYPLITSAAVAYPPASGLMMGGWLIAGTLGGLIIRKPGAAVVCELLAAVFQALLGTHFGMLVLVSGAIQGLGSELIFATTGYRRFGPLVATAAGALAGLFGSVSECIIYYYEWPLAHQSVYVVFATVSGAVIAGILMWALTRALRSTGVLSALSSGR
ncbi:MULTISPECIES: ECF transporter S component [Kocuria]|uniref:ECF transporter S component n=1 Tax=Kocuria subflava TaxID=1736139 RepID=A0A846THF2_9MICC|nr:MULTISPECIES: ECF transporter S component [Kocuria]NKE08578.1 ECF transporter S component [Kocuria subflava]